jgi:hypothetical protein
MLDFFVINHNNNSDINTIIIITRKDETKLPTFLSLQGRYKYILYSSGIKSPKRTPNI